MNTQPPIEISDEQLATLCTCLESGLSRRLTANAMALLEEELQRWIDESPRREAILGTAEANFQLRCINILLSSAAGKNSAQLRAIMWLLESRFPDQYGKKKAAKPAKKPQEDPPAATPVPASAESANAVELSPQPLRNPRSEIGNNTNRSMDPSGVKAVPFPDTLSAAA